MKTNEDKLVKVSLMGEIRHPVFGSYKVDHHGVPRILPGTGGITYSHKVGDCCMDLVGDHVEPGVSIHHSSKRESDALMYLSCIGNEATVVSGAAKGSVGWVTGSHGGIENVIVDFKGKDMDKMAIGDKIQVKAVGQGLKVEDYPDLFVMNLDPKLFNRINLKKKGKKLRVPVVTSIPAYLMGSGIGSASAASGDYDIMTADEEEYRKLGLGKLRFGDFVFLENCDNTYGRGYLKGSASVGVVVHSDCVKMGHGPGVVVVMTAKKDILEGVIDPDANIVNLMKDR